MSRRLGLAEQLEQYRLQREAEAQAAWERGEAAFAAPDLPEALRWLERAHRLAPQDDTIRLVLGIARLRAQSPGAAVLFREVLATHDVRAAWVGLAAALLREGEPERAAAALQAALSRHAGAVDPALMALANDIVAATGAPGWCALRSGGTLVVSVVRPTIALDGRPLRLGTEGRLPTGWQLARSLAVSIGEVPLLGSPIALDRLRRVEGVVECRPEGIVGWAWHPADPEADPMLQLTAQGRSRRIVATAAEDLLPKGIAPLARPRWFRARLGRRPGLIGVRGCDGRDLLGSPFDPAPAAAAPAGRPRKRRVPAARVSVIVPVYGNADRTLACLDSLLAGLPVWAGVIVIDDASPDPQLAASLDRLAAQRRIRLLRNPVNLGFPASANRGLAAASGDVVLLNSDTLLPRGRGSHWLERLWAAAWSQSDIGTVTPLSNDATILSYPRVDGGNPVPDQAQTDRIDRLAARANGGLVIEIPTAVGFCMYIRRDCLRAVGKLREDVFAQGYGEENDFCMRALAAGWVHMAAPGVFVGHVGGGSFGAARAHLLARNLGVLNRLHPGYAALVAAHVEADPLAVARRRIDLAAWSGAGKAGRPAVLLLTHDMGGGVQRLVEARMAALSQAGFRPLVLRPILNRPGWCQVQDGSDRGFANLRFRLPTERAALQRFLARQAPRRIEVHHLVGHAPEILSLCRSVGGAASLPYEVYIHDYAWFCARISLIGPLRRYCGEPGPTGCVACITAAGRNIEEDIGPAELLQRSARELAGASRVIAPSADVAVRLRRHFPGLNIVFEPWDEVRFGHAAATLPAPRRRICVIGAIGVEKGFDVLLACAEDAASRNLPLEFIVVGYTIDDARLHATGRAFVTGLYRDAELPELIIRQAAALAFLPSIWPETWCFTLSEAWRAGLAVVAFDIGAPAERIRREGHGVLLPLGLPPGSVNNILLSAGQSQEERKRSFF